MTQKRATFPCAVCGREFEPDAAHRCEACGGFACRECLKIHYHIDSEGRHTPTRTLCYNCYHSIYKKPYLEDDDSRTG